MGCHPRLPDGNLASCVPCRVARSRLSAWQHGSAHSIFLVLPARADAKFDSVSAASAQIETTAGDRIKTAAGLPDYGKVSAILIGVVSGWIIFFTLVGREALGSHFEQGKVSQIISLSSSPLLRPLEADCEMLLFRPHSRNVLASTSLSRRDLARPTLATLTRKRRASTRRSSTSRPRPLPCPRTRFPMVQVSEGVRSRWGPL